MREHWKSVQLPNTIEEIPQVFRDAKRRKETTEVREDTCVRERLEDIFHDTTRKVGSQHYYIVTRSYTNYILANDEAFDYLAELADATEETYIRQA